MPSQAANTFTASIGTVDQLIRAHSRLQNGRGRRHEQEAIHRAGVVLTIGAWEGYIERVLLDSLALIEANAAGAGVAAIPAAWARHAFSLFRAGIEDAVKQFNTPNSQNVRRLFQSNLRFDPWAHWNWHSPRRQWNSNTMRTRLDDWLRIRHGVAHGSGLPADIAWIHGPHHHPRLTLSLLKDCKNFATHLVKQTDDALRDFLIQEHGLPAPW